MYIYIYIYTYIYTYIYICIYTYICIHVQTNADTHPTRIMHPHRCRAQRPERRPPRSLKPTARSYPHPAPVDSRSVASAVAMSDSALQCVAVCDD